MIKVCAICSTVDDENRIRDTINIETNCSYCWGYQKIDTKIVPIPTFLLWETEDVFIDPTWVVNYYWEDYAS